MLRSLTLKESTPEGWVCWIRQEAGFVPVLLPPQDLASSCDLHEGDTFTWDLAEDGIILPEAVTQHPRRFDPGEYATLLAACDSFDELP